MSARRFDPSESSCEETYEKLDTCDVCGLLKHVCECTVKFPSAESVPMQICDPCLKSLHSNVQVMAL